MQDVLVPQKADALKGAQRGNAGGDVQDPVPPLPHDSVAEAAVIGSILIDNTRLPVARRYVQAGDFYDPLHVTVFGAMERLARGGIPIDLVTVTREMVATGEVSSVDKARVAKLMDGGFKSANITYYCEIVAACARRRRMQAACEAIVRSVSDGVDEQELRRLVANFNAAERCGQPRIRPVNLYGDDVVPEHPAFTVTNLIRRGGLHLVWAQPGAGKTWTILRLLHELLMEQPPKYLFGHHELEIATPYRRALWIGTEETTGILRSNGDMVLRGLGVDRLGGELLHLWAPDPWRPITLNDLPDILEADGPFDAVVLDSLTGLRPKLVNGERVRWDLDNDASNELCLMLRAMAASKNIDIFIVHHTGREVQKGYRGPTEWWASADVMVGLVPEQGRLKVVPEKNRDGSLLRPFYVVRSWGPDGFSLSFDGEADAGSLPPGIQKADAFLRGRGRASQVEIVKGSDVGRSTVQRAATKFVAEGLWRDTGERINNSPVYEHAGGTGKDHDGA